MGPPGDAGPPAPGDRTLGWFGILPGGAPCRPRWTACILASISCETLRPLPRLEMVGAFGGRGFRAALILPSGVDEGVMLAVAPLVETERTGGRPSVGEPVARLGRTSRPLGGEEGEGEPKGPSESKSSPLGVEAAESMVGGGWRGVARDAGKDNGGGRRARRELHERPCVWLPTGQRRRVEVVVERPAWRGGSDSDSR